MRTQCPCTPSDQQAAIETGANEEKHGFFMEKATIGNV